MRSESSTDLASVYKFPALYELSLEDCSDDQRGVVVPTAFTVGTPLFTQVGLSLEGILLLVVL
jgi:hypothetical protein